MAVLCLSLTAVVGGLPAAAAESPEAAVHALFDAVTEGALDDLDRLVCAEAQESVREALDPSQADLVGMDSVLGSMALEITDRTVEVIEQDEASAVAQIAATLSMDVDATEMEDFVRSAIDASLGPDDPPVSDEDLALMMPFMVDALAADQVIDGEMELVLEDGQWLVCSGLGDAVEDRDEQYEAEPIVTLEGLCALATPTELSGLSSLEYDSSTGFNEFCTYSRSDLDAHHAATVIVTFGSTLDEWMEVYAPDGELEIAGAAAFSSGQSVFTQAGEDVLQVSVALPDVAPEDIDAVTQGVRIAELFVPRLPDLVMIDLPAEGPDPNATPGPSLCDGMSLEELNLTSGRAFGSTRGSATQCTWESLGGEAGYDTIVASVSDVPLDDFREWMTDSEDLEIEARPAVVADNQVVVGLSDGRTLDITVWYDEEAAEPALPADILAGVVAESLVADIPAVPPVSSGGLLRAEGWIEDVCAVVPFERLADLSGITFEDPGFGADYCEYYGGGESVGWHYATTSLEERPLRAWFADYPEASTLEVAGQSAALVSGIFPDFGESAAVFVSVPGFPDLTFAVGLGIDTGTGFEADAQVIASEVAGLALERLTGPTG